MFFNIRNDFSDTMATLSGYKRDSKKWIDNNFINKKEFYCIQLSSKKNHLIYCNWLIRTYHKLSFIILRYGTGLIFVATLR